MYIHRQILAYKLQQVKHWGRQTVNIISNEQRNPAEPLSLAQTTKNVRVGVFGVVGVQQFEGVSHRSLLCLDHFNNVVLSVVSHIAVSVPRF